MNNLTIQLNRLFCWLECKRNSKRNWKRWTVLVRMLRMQGFWFVQQTLLSNGYFRLVTFGDIICVRPLLCIYTETGFHWYYTHNHSNVIGKDCVHRRTFFTLTKVFHFKFNSFLHCKLYSCYYIMHFVNSVVYQIFFPHWIAHLHCISVQLCNDYYPTARNQHQNQNHTIWWKKSSLVHISQQQTQNPFFQQKKPN